MNTFEEILKLRRIVLFTSKVIAIIFCIYYIMHVNNYKVSWSLFDYLMPTYISKINNMLSGIGTYILVIPLTIIIGSILMPESTKLHLMSSLFGILSIVITTIKNIATNNATEITNFRLFKVSYILSLDEKREIFITECNRIIQEKYVGMIKIYNYLISKLSGDIILQYDTVLESLNLPSQIKQYSNALILELVTDYQKQAVQLIIPWKPIIIGSFVIISVLIGTAIANSLVTDWAPIIKDTILGLQNINKLSLDLTKQIMNLTTLIKDHTLNITKCATGLISVNQRVDQHDAAIDMILKKLVALNKND